MDGKYIKKRITKVAIPILTLIVAATQLSGCSSSSKSQVVDTVNEIGGDTQVEFLIEENEFTEQGTQKDLDWVKLANLNTYPGFRGDFESVMNIKSESGIKSGCVYVGTDGKLTDNPTLLSAFSNKATADQFNSKETQDYLRTSIKNTYADIEDSDEYAAIINAYFNILPDSTPNYFNGGKSLTRLEAMTAITRAITPVDHLTSTDDTRSFTQSLGDTPYTTYAALANSNSFISTSDNSLTQDNANKTMSKGEFVYLVMNTIYGSDAVEAVDLTTSKLTDVTAVTPTEHTKTNAEQLALALQTPTQAPESIYKALVLANENGLVDTDTQWNTAITKSTAIEFVIDTIQSYNEKTGYSINDKGTLTDTESKAEAEAKEKEKILAEYNAIKDEVTCDGETFYKEYKELRDANENISLGEAVMKISEKYAKPIETTTATTTETVTTTTQAAQQQSGGNNGGGNSGGGTPQYVEPPQQQTQPVYTPPVTEPVYTPPVETPTEAPVVTPPSGGGETGGNNNGGGRSHGRFNEDLPEGVEWNF